MTTVTRVALALRAPLHFGRRGVGLNETDIALPADGLFSALCVALAALKGPDQVTALLARFPMFDAGAITPPLRITSLMPTANGIDLLPMPLLRPRLGEVGVAARKDWKRLAWVSKTIFQKLVAGQELTADDSAIDRRSGRHDQAYTVQDRTIWVSRAEQTALGGEDAVLWKIDTRPRVTVDRQRNASAAFSSGSVHFTDNHKLRAGLYALLRWEVQEQELTHAIHDALTLLGESGIGGERSYGLGQFTPLFDDVTDDLGSHGGEYFTSLAPYLPQPSEWEVFGPGSRYDIQLRRGWISMPEYNHLRRPTVRMVGDGAILVRPRSGDVIGSMADATPSVLQGRLVIRRYGIAWPVPVATVAVAAQ